MEKEGAYCNTKLGLGLGTGGGYAPIKMKEKRQNYGPGRGVSLELSFAICTKEEDDQKTEGSRSTDEEKRCDSGDINKNSCRKKLRLSKEQSSLLEDSFKLHTSLNPAQKHALAEKLNLKPRQVEVWFQNRRARTKLKQTERDHEFLKKCCERLSDENRRLKKELQDLRALKAGTTPRQIQFPNGAATLAICSSCEKIVRANDEKNAASMDVVKKNN